MYSDYPTPDPTTGLIMQLLPITIIQILYAIAVFQLCRKQGWNAWLWTIVTLIPMIGLINFIIVFISSQLNTLDRLNVLEGKAPKQ